MRVKVMGRRRAVLYCYQENAIPTVMISVSDPRMHYVEYPFCSKSNQVLAILELSFSDADDPKGLDVYGHEVTSNDLMSDEDGRKIAEFLNKHKDTDVIVHCDAGISRSAGIGSAILKAYTGDDSAIFDDGYHMPNMWCYRKTLNALVSDPMAKARGL